MAETGEEVPLEEQVRRYYFIPTLALFTPRTSEIRKERGPGDLIGGANRRARAGHTPRYSVATDHARLMAARHPRRR